MVWFILSLTSVFLTDAIRYMSCDGAKFLCPFNVEHVIIKEDVGPDFTRIGPLGAPARKRASSISRPHRRRVFSTRAPELAALLAVTK